MVGTQIGTSPLSNTGHVLSGKRGGSPRVCTHAPRRGDCRCTPVPCIGQNHGLRHQPTLQTMQVDSPSSQQGLLLGWGGSLCPTRYGGASSVPGQAPAIPGGWDCLTRSGERFACSHGLRTKCAAQAIGRAMGFMVVQQRHLWLTLADLKDSDPKVLLKAQITPSGLFGDAVESIIERFSEAQKCAKAMSHVMPRRSFQPPSRSRSSLATRPPQRREERPATATAAPRREPDVRRKVWPAPGKRCQGQQRSPR